MFGFFIACVVLLGGAAAVALIRGLVAFHDDGRALRSGDEAALAGFGKQQNRMMTQRILFQGLAVVAVGIIGLLFASNS